MPLSNADRLRDYLGEPIPAGGHDTDTMFTDAQIADILDFAGIQDDPRANLYGAAAEGWERKASLLAELVTTQTGGAQRQMSDLFTHALKRAEHFHELSSRRDFTRIGPIARPGTTIR